MKRLSIARKFYPRLRYIRINISKLLAALLQVGMLQSSLVQSTGLPVVMASLVGAAGTAQAEVISGLRVGMGGATQLTGWTQHPILSPRVYSMLTAWVTCVARVSRGHAQTRCAQTVARPDPINPALLGGSKREGKSKAPDQVAKLVNKLDYFCLHRPARRNKISCH